ncbi:GDP-L-fucose synthase [Prochlorococcus sp. MIT 1341]|uniref:GDP-L-fucose synthase family protein n=1 Tax=Prochlorococcus sp. MIT 1341 TaxID=3096221 RepID=UPI002A74EACC|nr:GDP-L-fucose synthase [Prochlorococcus sp. MIT 1341]
MQNLIQLKDRIFIAGHNGMVGSAICRSLLSKNYTNILTANRSDLDLEDFDSVDNWIQASQPDVVVLAAAKVGGIEANNMYPASFLLQNLKIQNNVIEASWRNGVRRLLFLGSSCIYPKYAIQPIKEEALLESALEPTNQWYAIAKISGIKLCNALRIQYGFDAISLMPTNLYGPGDNYHPRNSHVLPSFIRRFNEAAEKGEKSVTCWGSGSPYREFLHVDDLSDACVYCLEKWKPKKDELQFLNVGTGVDLTIKELAETVANITGYQGQILWDKSKPDGTPRKLLNIDRISTLGWKAKIPLVDGLKDTVALFKQTNHQLRT